MKRLGPLLVFSIISIGLVASAKEVPEAKESDAFIFMAGKVTAQTNSGSKAIELFDGKKFHLVGVKRPIRPGSGIPGKWEPIVAISDLYTEISNLEFKFSDSGASLESIAATGVASAIVARGEFTPTPGVVSQGGRIRIVGSTSSQTDEFRDLHSIEERLVAGDPTSPKNNRLMGQLKGKGDLVAKQTISNAYAALVMRFSRTFPGNEQAQLPSLTRIIRVGDLEAGKTKKLKFNLTFPKLLASEADLEFFLFDGMGKCVATNLSRDLQKLTPAQVKEFTGDVRTTPAP